MQDKKAVVLSTLLHIVFCFGFSPKLETLNGAEASACSVTVLLQPSSPPTPSQAHLSRDKSLHSRSKKKEEQTDPRCVAPWLPSCGF